MRLRLLLLRPPAAHSRPENRPAIFRDRPALVAAALDAWGPDHVFRTPVYRQGAQDGATLDGNLVLVEPELG